MNWVPRTKPERNKMRRVPDPPAPKLRKLRCGHETDDGPVTSGRTKLYRCPEGCGLQKQASYSPKAA